MSATILINRSFGETRVALLEDGSVSEIYVERDHELGLVGNIYKGRVTRVLPGIQAAFVDIGLDRAAFLYADDILSPDYSSHVPKPGSPKPGNPELDKEEHPHDIEDEKAAPENNLIEAAKAEVREQAYSRPTTNIANLVTEGDEIVCQISKDPIGSKGARISTYVTLPGRYLVFMPTTDHIGVSKRITEEAERDRLRKLIEELRTGTCGYIVRTEGANLSEEKLREDMEFLGTLWTDVSQASKHATAPSLLQPDLDLVLRATRDLFAHDVERLVIDNPKELKRIECFLSRFSPELIDRLSLYTSSIGLFEHNNVEGEIERALQRKVGMKSGASIVIDQAEALTAIDVNTGGFVGKQNLEATILRTNLEAVKEVVTQLRLRNIGGIIVIDFIDMQSADARERVYTAFVEELTRDRAKTHVLPISELGVIEMTRKRVRESLGRRLTEACPYCEGRGRIRSRLTIAHEIFREVMRQANKGGHIMVLANPEIAAMLAEEESDTLTKVEEFVGKPVVVEARNDFHHEAYRVILRRP